VRFWVLVGYIDAVMRKRKGYCASQTAYRLSQVLVLLPWTYDPTISIPLYVTLGDRSGGVHRLIN
jgi:hypothetical protein